jgi:hypothetical protein
MPRPTVEKLMRVLYRDGVVYDIDTDSLIRQYANNTSALALFGILTRMDDAAPDFGDHLRAAVKEANMFGPSCLMSFDDGSWDHLPQGEPEEEADATSTSEHFLKLVWVSDEAAYFAFSMLTYLDAPYIRGASRKREGNMHHLRLELDSPERLDKFIASLRGPFFVKVEESTEEIFNKAPSHAV